MRRPPRLTKLETSVSATEAVLIWLAEANCYGSLTAYAIATLEQPAPVDRIADLVEASVAERLAGRSASAQLEAARAGIQDAIFRYALVLRLNEAVASFVAGARSLGSLLVAHLNLLTQALSCHPAACRADPATSTEIDRTWRQCLALVESFVGDVRGLALATMRLEATFLDGQSALFADTAEGWDVVCQQARVVEALVDTVPAHQARLMPGLASKVSAADSATARADALAADLVSQSQSDACELLGDAAGARTALEVRLRAIDGSQPG
ncbi:MAG: hypothetical protein H0W81_09460 [Chloroflexi bacterium]|nr:hypothetical protein [Chloroflexota bacterium]